MDASNFPFPVVNEKGRWKIYSVLIQLVVIAAYFSLALEQIVNESPLQWATAPFGYFICVWSFSWFLATLVHPNKKTQLILQCIWFLAGYTAVVAIFCAFLATVHLTAVRSLRAIIADYPYVFTLQAVVLFASVMMLLPVVRYIKK